MRYARTAKQRHFNFDDLDEENFDFSDSDDEDKSEAKEWDIDVFNAASANQALRR